MGRFLQGMAVEWTAHRGFLALTLVEIRNSIREYTAQIRFHPPPVANMQIPAALTCEYFSQLAYRSVGGYTHPCAGVYKPEVSAHVSLWFKSTSHWHISVRSSVLSVICISRRRHFLCAIKMWLLYNKKLDICNCYTLCMLYIPHMSMTAINNDEKLGVVTDLWLCQFHGTYCLPNGQRAFPAATPRHRLPLSILPKISAFLVGRIQPCSPPQYTTAMIPPLHTISSTSITLFTGVGVSLKFRRLEKWIKWYGDPVALNL